MRWVAHAWLIAPFGVRLLNYGVSSCLLSVLEGGRSPAFDTKLNRQSRIVISDSARLPQLRELCSSVIRPLKLQLPAQASANALDAVHVDSHALPLHKALRCPGLMLWLEP
jgi:hypothetical protein